MRRTDRTLFLKEIEEKEYARRQEKVRREEEVAVERQRLLGEDAERQRIHTIGVSILECFHLQEHIDSFLSCADGLALLANCCNFAAKSHDLDFYEHKPMLIEMATEDENAEAWQSCGIVYIETSVGQVSFHALDGEDIGLPEANGRVWSGLEYQFNAALVSRAWLNGWSKFHTQQVVRAIMQRRENVVEAS